MPGTPYPTEQARWNPDLFVPAKQPMAFTDAGIILQAAVKIWARKDSSNRQIETIVNKVMQIYKTIQKKLQGE